MWKRSSKSCLWKSMKVNKFIANLSFINHKLRNEFGDKFGDYSSFIPSSMSFLLTVGFLKVGNQPTTATGNANARCGKCKPCTSFEPSVPFPPFVPSFTTPG